MLSNKIKNAVAASLLITTNVLGVNIQEFEKYMIRQDKYTCASANITSILEYNQYVSTDYDYHDLYKACKDNGSEGTNMNKMYNCLKRNHVDFKIDHDISQENIEKYLNDGFMVGVIVDSRKYYNIEEGELHYITLLKDSSSGIKSTYTVYDTNYTKLLDRFKFNILESIDPYSCLWIFTDK